MRPSLILGLSALILGAAGQSQYRPGGSSGEVGGLFSGLDNSDYYPDYEEQSQYRPGGFSDYEYENSISGGSPVSSGSSDSFGGNQVDQSGSVQNSDNQGQYVGQGEFAIAGSTGNVGSGIHGDLESADEASSFQGRPTSQQSRPNPNRPDASGSGGFSGNVDPENSKQGSESSNNPSGSGSSSKGSQKEDKTAWSLTESIPGTAGDDYPILSEVPLTSFECDGRISGGYYADLEAECQAFHICASDGRGGLTKFSFICPNGTIFNQEILVCDWWFNVDCSLTEELYSINDANAAEREGYSGQGSTESEAGNNKRKPGNKDSQRTESQPNTRVNGIKPQDDNNQLVDSSDTQAATLDSISASGNKSPSKQLQPESIKLQRDPNSRNRLSFKGQEPSTGKKKRIQNKATIGPVSQGGGFIQPQETRPNDNFQLIQDAQTSKGGNEDYSDYESIQPLNTGYGAPGGPIIGSYDGQ